jgi:hypothetical protein
MASDADHHDWSNESRISAQETFSQTWQDVYWGWGWSLWIFKNLVKIYQASYSMCTRHPFCWVKQPGMELAAHLHLVQRLRVSGTIHLLPLYAFMQCTGTTLLHVNTHSLVSHNRSVGLGTGWSRNWCLTSGKGSRCFASPKHTNQLWNPPSLLLNRYWVPFLWIEWVGHEDDYTPPSTAKVKNTWHYNIHSPHIPSGHGD